MKSERPGRAGLRRHAKAHPSTDVVPNEAARAAGVTIPKQGDRTMSDSDDPKNAAAPSRFSPSRLRLSQAFNELAGVTKLITTVPVRKPDVLSFVRTHPNPAMSLVGALMLERVGGRETFLVDPALYTELATVAKLRILHLAISRQGTIFIWPVGMAGADGRSNSWNDSAQQAAEMARTKWLRVVANMALGAYDIFVPLAELPDPEWPDLTFERILEIAFRDHFIDSADHPVLKQLRGEV